MWMRGQETQSVIHSTYRTARRPHSAVHRTYIVQSLVDQTQKLAHWPGERHISSECGMTGPTLTASTRTRRRDAGGGKMQHCRGNACKAALDCSPRRMHRESVVAFFCAVAAVVPRCTCRPSPSQIQRMIRAFVATFCGLAHVDRASFFAPLLNENYLRHVPDAVLM
jgi:hypothetical protein